MGLEKKMVKSRTFKRTRGCPSVRLGQTLKNPPRKHWLYSFFLLDHLWQGSYEMCFFVCTGTVLWSEGQQNHQQWVFYWVRTLSLAKNPLAILPDLKISLISLKIFKDIGYLKMSLKRLGVFQESILGKKVVSRLFTSLITYLRVCIHFF